MPEEKGLPAPGETAADWQLNDADWNEMVRRQGDILHRLIREETGREKIRLLDCSGGSSAWAIGLARHGHAVTVTDLSPSAARSRQEATAAGVAVAGGATDVRSLAAAVPGYFDVVIAGNSSLPQLVTDADWWLAVKSLWQKLEPGGLLLMSHRDFDRHPAARLRVSAPDDGGKQIVFQHWDWLERENIRTVNDFVIWAKDGNWVTEHSTTLYRELSREEMTTVLTGTGFGAVRWLEPAATGYNQPIVMARKHIRGEG